jgi:hypothetical protein
MTDPRAPGIVEKGKKDPADLDGEAALVVAFARENEFGEV